MSGITMYHNVTDILGSLLIIVRIIIKRQFIRHSLKSWIELLSYNDVGELSIKPRRHVGGIANMDKERVKMQTLLRHGYWRTVNKSTVIIPNTTVCGRIYFYDATLRGAVTVADKMASLSPRVYREAKSRQIQ